MATLILLAGMVFRFRQYLFNRSLWLDEAMLANNIVTHSLRYLLTQKLEFEQVAPIGFLAELKLSGKLLGYQDYFMRLVPLIFGLAILPVAGRLKNRFRHPLSQYLFLGLIAFSPVLIYYSSEVKPYILDVFFSILLLWAGLNYRHWKNGYLWLFFCGFAAILDSNPSVYILAAILIPPFLGALRKREWQTMARLAGIGFTWLLLFALIYLLFTRNILQNGFLVAYWQVAFAPGPFTLDNVKWYLDTMLGLAYIGFSPPAPVVPGPLLEWYGTLNWVVLAGMLAGAFALYRRNRDWFMIEALTVILLLISSWLQFYPFRSRPILFLIPILFSFLCAAVDWLLTTSTRLLIVPGTVMAILFGAMLAVPAINLFLSPANSSDIKGALAYITEHPGPGNQIAFSQWSLPAYEFYHNSYPLETLAQVDLISSNFDVNGFLNGLCMNKQFGYTWIVLSHRFSEGKAFINNLSASALLLDKWESPGSGAYLFDFTKPAFCKP